MKNDKYIETIKIFNGEIYHIEYHQKRYETVMISLGKDKFAIL